MDFAALLAFPAPQIMLGRNLDFRASLLSEKPHKYVIWTGDLFFPLSASPLFTRVSNIEINSKITRLRRAIGQIRQEQCREPTAAEIAFSLGISVKEVQEIQACARGVASLDTPISEDNSLTLVDTLQADLSPENDVIDKIYAKHSENELWGILERYTAGRENYIIKEIFLHGKSMSQVAREQGLSHKRIRKIKERGLHKLRTGRARRELLEKFDIAESALYKGGRKSYREHNFTSVVEYIAIRKAEAEERYKRHLEEIELHHPQKHFFNFCL